MAVIRREIPASTQDLFARQWLLTIVDGERQEMDEGRLVYIAQATGKRMTRAEDGKFVGLDGTPVTEEDLAESFDPSLVPVHRMESVIVFDGDDAPGKIGDVRSVIGGTKFNRVKGVLAMLMDVTMAEKVKGMDGAAIVDGEESPLDRS